MSTWRTRAKSSWRHRQSQFRNSQRVSIYPIEIVEAKLIGIPPDIPAMRTSQHYTHGIGQTYINPANF